MFATLGLVLWDLLKNSSTVLRFEWNTLFKESRAYDASDTSIFFPGIDSFTGRVKSRIDLVKTKVTIQSKEDNNL